MNEYNENYSQELKKSRENIKMPTDKLSGGNTRLSAQDDEVIYADESFDFDGFQVVRREFFAHIREPSVTFNNCKFYVNTACLTKFPAFDYAQVLVNRESKILALRPCKEDAMDSFRWCNISKGKRKPKPITCKLFFAKIASMMEWDPRHRYKILGKLIYSNDEYLIAFDLTATEVYQRTAAEGEKVKTSRIPVFPADWQNQFGLPYNEHKEYMRINIVDGYAVYSIKDTAKKFGALNTQSENAAETNEISIGLDNSGGGDI